MYLTLAAMYANVKRQLQAAERSASLRLSSLALRPLHFRPVVRALQFQTSLKELELPGNTVFILPSTYETVFLAVYPVWVLGSCSIDLDELNFPFVFSEVITVAVTIPPPTIYAKKHSPHSGEQ